MDKLAARFEEGRLRGLSAAETGNLLAYKRGLWPVRSGWTLREPQSPRRRRVEVGPRLRRRTRRTGNGDAAMIGEMACAHGAAWSQSCATCGRVAGITDVATRVAFATWPHQHAFHPAGMRRVPDWQVVEETWEALLVCTCGFMEWRRAPAVRG